MPVRVGFTQYRREMLERELQRVQDLLPSLGVEKVILTGDMATGDYAPDSRIELIIVQKTELPFGRRADFFSNHFDIFLFNFLYILRVNYSFNYRFTSNQKCFFHGFCFDFYKRISCMLKVFVTHVFSMNFCY